MLDVREYALSIGIYFSIRKHSDIFTLHILPLLLPLIDSGGSSSGIVVLRIVDLFVRLEFMPVTLEEFIELVKFDDIGVIMSPVRELAKESLSPSELLKRNSGPRAMEFA